MNTGPDSTIPVAGQEKTAKDNSSFFTPPDANQVNELLRASFWNKWHVLTDQEAGWEANAFRDYINAGRKKNPNYPYIVKGDFDGDGRIDFAAVVTDNQKVYDRINTRIAVLPAAGTIVILDEDANRATLGIRPKSDLEGTENGNPKKVKMRSEGVKVVMYDVGGYVVYWSGSAFKVIWLEE